MNITTKEDLADLIIDRLNEISDADPVAIDWLLSNRIATRLEYHPTVQVKDSDHGPTVGILGIINGIVGVIDEGSAKGSGLIAATWSEDEGRYVFLRTPNEV